MLGKKQKDYKIKKGISKVLGPGCNYKPKEEYIIKRKKQYKYGGK